jgi:hypothetical protein
MIISNLFSYYSVWNLMILLASNSIVFYDCISYVPWLVAIQSFIFGVYITHVYPGRVTILNMRGASLIFMDIALHHLLLFYASRPATRLDFMHWLPGNLPFLIYWSRYSILEKYELDSFDILICFLVYISMCLLFA